MASEPNKDPQPSTSKTGNSEEKNQITNHLVSLPSIILTRCDIGNEHILVRQQKITKKSTTKSNITKPSAKKPKVNGNVVRRPTGRPRKDSAKLSFLKQNKNESVAKNKRATSRDPVKMSRSDTNSGRVSKKTILQKRSKIAIPTKKAKLIQEGVKQKPFLQKKEIPKEIVQKKQTPPKPKLTVLPSKQSQSDSSDDEFLYDELIEELENTANKRMGAHVVEKTTNITLKSNIGNKPPIVVKGGIVKKTDLPADLKSIASSDKINIKSSDAFQKLTSSVSQLTPIKNNKRVSDAINSPGPAKKASPWPISISNSTKKTSVGSSHLEKLSSTARTAQSAKTATPTKSSGTPVPKSKIVHSVSKSVVMEQVKPRIGPKQTSRIAPLSKRFQSDGDSSDASEYLEEETLECEFEPNANPTEYRSVASEDTTSSKNSINEPAVQSKDNDDPNLDLLRILTDESVDTSTTQRAEKKHNIDQGENSRVNMTDIVEKEETKEKPSPVTSNHLTTEEPTTVVEEEPPVRTIYDLMNEYSLEQPSWNLHIIPETSAFCIAQVTKGRLGLPTLKKCIELDPVNYSAKVYIHQYHIKRFDGVYDSEESILALIHEINNIKA